MKPFRKIFPGNEPQLLDGGLATKFSKAIIENNESPDCANVVFEDGTVGTRQGVGKLNTTPIGTFPIDGLYTRRANTGAETMVAFSKGSMWQLGTTTFTTIASAQSLWTAQVRVAATQYQGSIFVGNGSVIPYKYNGTDFTRHGIYPPTQTATVASNAVGLVNGDVQYKVTYLNSALVESDVGPASTTFAAANGTMRVSAIQAAPQSFGVASRRLYRSDAGASYKRVTTIADNTTTTFDDNLATASLGALAPTDKGVPPNWSAIIYLKDRLFMNDPANPNFVWWTDLNEPYTVAALNFQRVGDNSSDIVRGFAVDNGNLVVLCDRTVTVGFMQDTTPGNWKWVVTKSPYGSKSPFGAFNALNKAFFPAVQSDKFVGFAALAGDNIDPNVSVVQTSKFASELQSNRIEPDMFQIQEAQLGNVSSFVFKNKAYITLTYQSPNTINNRIYVMDFSYGNLNKDQKMAWVPYTGTKLAASQFTVYGGNLYYGSALSDGYVYKMESGLYGDDGSAIDSYFWTKEFGGIDGDQNFTKDFRYLNMLVDNAGNYPMNLTYRVDSDKGVGNTIAISLNPGGSLWGTMKWGLDAWGGGTNQKEFREPLGTSRGKRIQYKFTNQNTLNQRFKIHWLNFSYNIKGYR